MMSEKLEILKNQIKKLENLAVAFSGGVDSSLLLKIASEALKERALAISVYAPYTPEREINEAKAFCTRYKIKHEIIKMGVLDELRNNPKERCYLCKKAIFSRIIARANELKFTNIADGTNKDDLSEFRPGLRAKDELGVLSPLINFDKNQIRALSRELNLATADKASYSCLLTRLAHERKFSLSEFGLIERVENLMILNGYSDIRARFDGKSFKLELKKADMSRFIKDKNFKYIMREIANFGDFDIALDLKSEILKEKA